MRKTCLYGAATALCVGVAVDARAQEAVSWLSRAFPKNAAHLSKVVPKFGATDQPQSKVLTMAGTACGASVTVDEQLRSIIEITKVSLVLRNLRFHELLYCLLIDDHFAESVEVDGAVLVYYNGKHWPWPGQDMHVRVGDITGGSREVSAALLRAVAEYLSQVLPGEVGSTETMNVEKGILSCHFASPRTLRYTEEFLGIIRNPIPVDGQGGLLQGTSLFRDEGELRKRLAARMPEAVDGPVSLWKVRELLEAGGFNAVVTWTRDYREIPAPAVRAATYAGLLDGARDNSGKDPRAAIDYRLHGPIVVIGPPRALAVDVEVRAYALPVGKRVRAGSGGAEQPDMDAKLMLRDILRVMPVPNDGAFFLKRYQVHLVGNTIVLFHNWRTQEMVRKYIAEGVRVKSDVTTRAG